mmetsp:Transcript_3548/g.8355  ORF Transcript_3548/g.8355 Transcript_3548/m.8355 type:complete len:136 (+) Transcript_3548:95-502(+)
MGCTDSKPVAKPAKAQAAKKQREEKRPEQSPAAEPAPEVTPVPQAEVVESTEGAKEDGAPEVPEAEAEAQQVVEAKGIQEEELPVIPDSQPGLKEVLEDSETTLPKEEESPRLLGLKVEVAPDAPRGLCVCTNFW